MQPPPIPPRPVPIPATGGPNLRLLLRTVAMALHGLPNGNDPMALDSVDSETRMKIVYNFHGVWVRYFESLFPL